tara:strand:- start:873 stop:1391 length:519 start_codon:yes stop_codon:yes gene_type:complete
MGAGKTTIGRYLANALQLPFIDTDHEIEERSGADIPWIFDVEGEQGFRDREHKVLCDICQASPAVIATGGGIVVREDNRHLLSQSGTSVFLQASVNQQLKRTGNDRSRPLLNHGDPEQTLKALMTIREPLYKEVADIICATENNKPRLTAQSIVKELELLHSSNKNSRHTPQ